MVPLTRWASIASRQVQPPQSSEAHILVQNFLFEKYTWDSYLSHRKLLMAMLVCSVSLATATGVPQKQPPQFYLVVYSLFCVKSYLNDLKSASARVSGNDHFRIRTFA